MKYNYTATPLVGLIDTGASDCLFDKDVADDLGIDLQATSVIRHYVGIDGEAVIGYVHQVSIQIIQISKFSEWIEVEAGFLDCKLPFPLLGQSGFFDNYEITLRRYRGKFEIKSRTYL
ncbi:MAG TPA: aspartyl protease family protein [Pyrinomonadaceae bacterium]|nr:aspartyl protease family protein [Pyrinomonadaceae bacterium]